MVSNRPSSTISIWPRPHFETGGRKAEFEFFCFATDPVPEHVPFVLTAEGYPRNELPLGVAMRTDCQDDQSEPLFYDSYRESLRSEHPELVPQLDKIRFRHFIIGEVPDPKDLSYLQAAWAAVRWCLRHGAFVVRDVRMEKWRTREEVLAQPSEDPHLACGWQVLVESEDSGFGYLAYTKGMSKFGRPDIITAVPHEMLDEITSLLHFIASNMAEGRCLPTGHSNMTNNQHVFEAYVPGINAPPRDFFNDEVVFLRLQA